MEPTTAIAGAFTIAASTKALEKVVEDVYDLSKDGIRENIKRWRTASKIKTLAKKLSTIRRVKTIWQFERPIDIFSFYYPTKILKDGVRREFRSLAELTKEGNVVVEGTVGQGKSMLLRYLSAHEIYRGEVIPLFIELRNFEAGEKLLEYVFTALDTLGLDGDQKTFDFLSSSGKVILCLDGFDEVKLSARAKLIGQLEAISFKHDALRIVVTSRPDNGIDKSAHFRVLKLAALERSEVRGVLDRLTGDIRLTEEIQLALEKRKHVIDGLLTTPLMVTLLALSYKIEKGIPETIADFYEALFSTLLVRHDKLKPDFLRERKCGLTDEKLRKMFDAMCFLCRKQQLLTIQQPVLEEICARSRALTQVDVDPHKFLDDIRHITCLLLEEAGTYHFIHKSVSEYHSASYIKRAPDDQAKKFYTAVAGLKHKSWEQELEFLQQIDPYRFSKDFLIPDIIAFTEEATARGESDVFFAAVRDNVMAMTIHLDRYHHVRSLSYGVSRPTSWSSWAFGRISASVISTFVAAQWRDVVDRLGKPISDGRPLGPGNRIAHRVEIAEVLGSKVVEPRVSILTACKEAARTVKKMLSDAQQLVESTDAGGTEFDGLG